MKQKIVDFINVIIGMRKLLAWFSLFLIAIVFRLYNLVDGAQFVDLMKATFLGFVAGNTTEHLTNMVSTFINSKSQSKNVKGEDEETDEEKAEEAEANHG